MEPPMLKKPKSRKDKTEDVGGKEMKFEYWESLPLDIRRMIAKETDVITRFSLMFSSKSNYRIARSVPIKIESIEVGTGWLPDYPGIDPNQPLTFIHLKKYDPSEIITTVCFVDHEYGTLVHRFWKKNKRVCAANTMLLEYVDYSEVSMWFLKNLMTLTDYQMDEFEYKIQDWGEDLEFLDKLRIRKKLSIMTSDGQTFNRWMNTAISPLAKLEIEIPIYPDLSHSDQFDLNHETINNAKELKLNNHTRSLEKFDFLRLKCDKFDVSSPEVTGVTVNEFIKKWINGDVPDTFQRGSFARSKFRNDEGSIESSQILDGLNYIPCRDEFRVNNKLISKCVTSIMRHSVCYYIETKKQDNGAALVFKNSEAVFLVTGKQKSIEQDD